MRVLVVYYSLYGHIHQMAAAVADGAREITDDVVLRRTPETLPPDVIEKMVQQKPKKQ
jgi:NAD(P)H dehydrogenase (quinone)